MYDDVEVGVRAWSLLARGQRLPSATNAGVSSLAGLASGGRSTQRAGDKHRHSISLPRRLSLANHSRYASLTRVGVNEGLHPDALRVSSPEMLLHREGAYCRNFPYRRSMRVRVFLLFGGTSCGPGTTVAFMEYCP